MDQSQEKKQSILSHLAALRKILIVSAAAVLIAFVVILSVKGKKKKTK